VAAAQNLRIDDDDIRHRDECGQSAKKLAANCGLIFCQTEVMGEVARDQWGLGPLKVGL
jgi:hypothetical protein